MTISVSYWSFVFGHQVSSHTGYIFTRDLRKAKPVFSEILDGSLIHNFLTDLAINLNS